MAERGRENDLLSALLSLAPQRERVPHRGGLGRTDPDHDHVVRLEVRPANVEGTSHVSMRDLVRQALRMRPGPEWLLAKYAAPKSLTYWPRSTPATKAGGTVHANSAVDVARDFEALALA